MAPYSVLAHANSSFLRRQSKSRDNFQNKFCMVNSTGCLDNNISLYCPFVHALPTMFCSLCPHKRCLAVCCILPFSVWPSEVWEPQCCQQAAGNHHHLWETGAGCRGECVCMCVCCVCVFMWVCVCVCVCVLCVWSLVMVWELRLCPLFMQFGGMNSQEILLYTHNWFCMWVLYQRNLNKIWPHFTKVWLKCWIWMLIKKCLN